MREKRFRLMIVVAPVTTVTGISILSLALFAGLTGYLASFNSLVSAVGAVGQYITSGGKLLPIDAIKVGAVGGGIVALSVALLLYLVVKIILKR